MKIEVYVPMVRLLCIFTVILCSTNGFCEEKKENQWKSLFDGKTLKNWESSQFGGDGDVYVEDGSIVLEFGSSMTGVRFKKSDLPKTNYELTFEAKRIDGFDFFCGLTFPVDQSHCSLILGGWGGAVVGLSSIDGIDASENDTNQIHAFKSGKWYNVRLQVTANDIQVWLDKKKIISQSLNGHKVSIRPEVELSRPLGFSSWETKAAIRKIRLRSLTLPIKKTE